MAEQHRKKRTYRRGKEEILETSRNTFLNGQGNGLKQKQVNVAAKLPNPTFGDDYSMKLLGDDLMKVSLKPMKMLIAEEMDKETECRRGAPSIIARLMGLDALPAQQVNSKQKRRTAETVHQASTFEKQRSQSETLIHAHERYPGKNMLHKIHPSHMHVMEHPEFKDVFEVQEASKVHKLHYCGHQSSKRSFKLPESNMDFVRPKFMDTKHLSTDEKLWHSKEFHDVLDDLDSNKDLFLRVLQEPDTLFAKHVHRLQTRPSPSVSNHITVLRSSKTRMEVEISDNYSNGGICWKSERQTGGRINMQKGDGSCPLNHNVAHCSCRGTSVSPVHRPCQSQGQKGDSHPTATRIVVLKPNHHKSLAEPKVLPSECTCTNHRMHRLRRSTSQDLFEEVIDWQKFSRNSSRINEGSVRPRPRGSREIAREVTRQLRQSVRRSSFNMPSRPCSNFIRDEDSLNLLKNDCIDDSGPFAHRQWSHELNSRMKSSPFCSFESPASTEAKKHLSDRWKIAQSSGELRHHGGSSSTLGEMIGMPELNNEMGKPLLTLGEMIGQDGCNDSLTGKEALTGWGCNADRRDRTSRQEGHATGLQRPRSRPVLAEGAGLVKADGRFGSVDDVTNDLIAREVISPRPEWSFFIRRHPGLEVKPFTEKWKLDGYKSHSSWTVKPNDDHLVSGNKRSTMHQSRSLDGAGSTNDKRVLSDNYSLLVSDLMQDMKQPKESVSVHEHYSVADSNRPDEYSCQDLEPSRQPMDLKKGYVRAVSPDPDNNITEVSSLEHSLTTSPPSCLPQNGLGDAGQGPLQKETAEQPSPVSILEPPFEEEFSSSDCFERISAGLHGLRKQLRLLRGESLQKDAEDSECESLIDEDLTDGCSSNFDRAESTGEENMEFSFLRDTLLSSGFYGDQDILSNAWYAPDCPLNPCLFDQLDKKYGQEGKLCSRNAKDVRWLRAERRRLFDSINEGLIEILRPSQEKYPWSKVKVRSRMPQRWGGRQLMEELWQLIQTGYAMKSGEAAEGEELTEMMVRMDLTKDGQWLELEEHVDLIGSQIERALISELMVEIAGDLRAL